MAKTVASPRKIAANRRNARKSTGPRTSAGKARARLNALKAGDLARACLSPLAGQPANSSDFSRIPANTAPVISSSRPITRAPTARRQPESQNAHVPNRQGPHDLATFAIPSPSATHHSELCT